MSGLRTLKFGDRTISYDAGLNSLPVSSVGDIDFGEGGRGEEGEGDSRESGGDGKEIERGGRFANLSET